VNERLEGYLKEYLEAYDVLPDAKTHLERFLGALKTEFKPVNNRCPICKAKVVAYTHRLNKTLVNALIKARAKATEKRDGEKPAYVIHPREELGLSKTEYNNWQKLRHWGLIAKYKVKGEWIKGYWVITKLGGDFISGNVKVPGWVKTFRNHKLPKGGESEKLVSVGDILDTEPVQTDWNGDAVEAIFADMVRK